MIEGKTRTNDNGNLVTETFLDNGNRYLFDFNLCKSDDGWKTVETKSDAPYFGVWVNPEKLEIMSFVEGDVYHTVCSDRKNYIKEIDGIIECHGVARFAVAIDSDTGQSEEYFQARAEYLPKQYGHLAQRFLSEQFELQVMKSNAGYYLGTHSPDGLPVSRESAEYWPTDVKAEAALSSGQWTQRQEP